MIQVWKCDHCSTSDVSPDVIREHEKKCSFNHVNKKCWTCLHSYEEGYNGEHIPGCSIGLDIIKGEEEGNCPGWVYYLLEKERNDKIGQIIED
jgi:hypothetical protein